MPMMTNAFLFFSVAFPRITLFYCWLTESLPTNQTSGVSEVLSAIFFPRFLCAYWIHETHTYVSGWWIAAYIVAAFLVASSSSVRVKKR